MSLFKEEKTRQQYQEELKVMKVKLQTLSIQIKNSPYNRNIKVLEQKRKQLMEDINKIEQILLRDVNL